MKTLLLRIGAPLGNGKRRLELFFEGPGEWWKLALASEDLPEDLNVDPPETLAGETVDRAFARSVFTAEQPQLERVEAAGKYLFRLLSTGSVGERWEELRQKYPAERPGQPGMEGLRLVLNFGEDSADAHELKALPWEGMAAPPDLFVFQDALNPGVIGCLQDGVASQPEDWPLRVLVVIGFAENDNGVAWQEELFALQQVLIRQRQLVEFELLVRPEAEELRERVRKLRPHILHFMGHGTLDAQTQQPALAFHRPASNDYRFWTAAEVRKDLRALPTIAFVFLNACRSKTAPNSAGHRWELARAFLGAGAKAVLGMRAEVRGVVAACLAERVYCGLFEGLPLDVALAEARISARNLLGSNTPDWAMACLEVQVHPDLVLPVRPARAAVTQLEQERPFCDVGALVDRHALRRELSHGIDPGPDLVPKPLIVVSGESEIGKTWLVRWCLYRAVLRGRQVLFVDLHRERSLSYVGVLEAIARGETTAPSRISGPIAPQVMRHFLYDVDRMLRKEKPAAWDGQTVPDELKLPRSVQEKLAEQVFQRFARALSEAAQAQPLILALDHLDRGVQPDHFTKYVLKHVVRPIGARTIPNVRLVITVQDKKKFDLDGLADATYLELRAFPRAEYIAHATEYLQLRGYPEDKRRAYRNLITSLSEFVGDPWVPKELHRLPLGGR